MKLPASVTCILRPRLPVATFHQIQRRLTCMLLHLNDWQILANIYVLPPFQNQCLNFVQTLVQSCTTTKVDTYFGTEAAKEKMIHAVPSPWTVNPDQASICWQRSSFLINEVCNLLTIGSLCAVSPKSRWASLWQRNWTSVIRIRLLGLVDET